MFRRSMIHHIEHEIPRNLATFTNEKIAVLAGIFLQNFTSLLQNWIFRILFPAEHQGSLILELCFNIDNMITEGCSTMFPRLQECDLGGRKRRARTRYGSYVMVDKDTHGVVRTFFDQFDDYCCHINWASVIIIMHFIQPWKRMKNNTHTHI